MTPNITSALDPNFMPAILAHKAYTKAVQTSPEKSHVTMAFEGTTGVISRYDMDILPLNDKTNSITMRYIERLTKFLLWSRGAWKIHFAGPAPIAEMIKAQYAPNGARSFDAKLMEQVYEHKFEVITCNSADIPATNEESLSIGKNLDGCRIGFDLGASCLKLSAAKDGTPIFTTEIPWNPCDATDPNYHYSKINEGLKIAAKHLPRVDAIGGSSAGVFMDNKPMVASLFRAVKKDDYETLVKNMFINLEKTWGVPVTIINDGNVTALAGAMALNCKGLFGISMGSSQAVGFIQKDEKITKWLNELAFAPIDLNPNAAVDEWSGDRGVGALYFSQQAINKLAPAAGLTFPESTSIADRARNIIIRTENKEKNCIEIFETIGIYLGYTIPWYSEFYDFDDLLILGGVTTGSCGDIIIDKARDVLKKEFPEIAAGINLHVIDKESRKIGQAVAAASLPSL